MSSILATLKKNKKNNLKTLAETFENDDPKNQYKDDRYWQPLVDKANKGGAIIRFLPAVTEPTKNVPKPEGKPYQKIYTNGFLGKGGWYIENSRTTIGEPDPVAEANKELWQSGDEAKKEIAKKQNRRLQYIMNIYVVKHPARPEDEGKVFLYKCPKTIFDKIKNKIAPDDENDEQEDIFDFWEGRNFKMKITDKGGFRNYDDSEWMSPGPVADDEKIEEIYLSQYPLEPEVSPDKFKPYDELKKLFEQATGKGKPAKTEDASKKTTRKPVEEESPFDVDDEKKEEETEEDDDSGDDMDFFQKLKNRKR